MPSIAQYERAALADLLSEVGPEAPTLCEGWAARDLAAHLVVRERRPDAGPGLVVKPLARWTGMVQRRYATRPFDELVELVRTGPGPFSAFSLPGVDTFLNTTEYVVHHEDVRRARPGWAPRTLPRAVQDGLWRAVAARASLAFRATGCGVVLQRSDVADRETSAVQAAKGSPTAVVAGEPLEVLLFLFGRRAVARVEVSGDDAAVAAVLGTRLDV
jgi:uncharacterized protein (TIGR03085 family)